jgi:hypothetical protein
MAKTRNDLAILALQQLQIIGVGQSARADDLELVKSKLDPLHDELLERDVIPELDLDALPDAYFSAFGDRLAAECAAAFGVPGVDIPATERRLKRLFSADPAYPVLKATFY